MKYFRPIDSWDFGIQMIQSFIMNTMCNQFVIPIWENISNELFDIEFDKTGYGLFTEDNFYPIVTIHYYTFDDFDIADDEYFTQEGLELSLLERKNLKIRRAESPYKRYVYSDKTFEIIERMKEVTYERVSKIDQYVFDYNTMSKWFILQSLCDYNTFSNCFDKVDYNKLKIFDCSMFNNKILKQIEYDMKDDEWVTIFSDDKLDVDLGNVQTKYFNPNNLIYDFLFAVKSKYILIVDEKYKYHGISSNLIGQNKLLHG